MYKAYRRPQSQGPHAMNRYCVAPARTSEGSRIATSSDFNTETLRGLGGEIVENRYQPSHRAKFQNMERLHTLENGPWVFCRSTTTVLDSYVTQYAFI